jgi:cytochrome c peroxidase
MRRKFAVINSVFVSVVFFVLLISANKKDNKIDIYYTEALNEFEKDLTHLQQLCSDSSTVSELKKQFIKTRLTYKKLALFTEFFNPYETKYLNGPALSRVEEDNPDVIIPPHGMQLIEEYIFGKWNTPFYRLIDKEIVHMKVFTTRLKNEPDRIYKFRDENIFDALRSSVVRLITLGITGFDSPVAKLSLPEARTTITAIQNVLLLYKDDIEKKAGSLFAECNPLINGSTHYLLSAKDFDSFDRLYFITTYADPLFSLITKIRDKMDLRNDEGRKPLNPRSASVFSADAFEVSFFSPDERYQITPERVVLGKQLFNDPILSEIKNRSCASCHKPELAFTDGLPVALSVDGKTSLIRNTPSLWNTVFQTRQFYDSRTNILENQLDEVVHNAEEMRGSLKQSVQDLKKHRFYNTAFKKAYPDEKETISAYNIANAISSYVRTLVALNSRFDQYMRGDKTKLTQIEKQGFNLFMGKAKCGTCHFMPLFNGLVPPEFNETESEVLGVPKRIKGKPILDPDLGKYNFTKAVIHKNAFKTPTIRNIELTAPYMHNGVFNTLDEVLNFYDKGGGAGLKIATVNQTLPPEKLKLTAKEKKAIIAFMQTLTDTAYKYKY